MTTLTIELINDKALKLIQELEELSIIRVIKSPASLSALRGKIKIKSDNEDINKQIDQLRSEWNRST